MTIPFPPSGVAGAALDPIYAEISELRAQMPPIARWAQELSTDVQMDLKKVRQLRFHMRRYRAFFAKLDARRQREGLSQDPDWPFTRAAGEVGSILRGIMQFDKITWASQNAMLTDLNALANDCQTFGDWIDANETRYKDGSSTVIVTGQDADGTDIVSDTPIVVAKPAAFQTRVAALRANFS